MPAFSVVIIGAGLNGLFAAVVLQKAGIDFIILEKRGAADLNGGSSVCLWPHNVRVLDQLGLMEDAQKTYLPIKRKCTIKRDGSILSWTNMIEMVNIYHGHPWMVFQRSELLEMLMNHVVNSENRIVFNKAAISIHSGSDNVKVSCADGSVYDASMVIGADGIHSIARSFVDGDRDEEAENQHAKEDFTTTYIGLYGRGYVLPSPVERETVYEAHAEHFSTQLIVPAAERYYFIIYHKLPGPSQGRQVVTVEDAERLVKEYGDVHLAPSLTLKQAWDAKEWWFRSPLEEGIASDWYKDRVLLLGDSAHKMTPNMGFGVNSGWQSTVVLSNLLKTTLVNDPNPSTEILKQLFAEFDAKRRQVVKKTLDISSQAARVQAWDTWFARVLDKYVLPYINGDLLLCKFLVSPLVSQGLILDSIPEPNFRSGTIRWANMPTSATGDTDKSPP